MDHYHPYIVVCKLPRGVDIYLQKLLQRNKKLYTNWQTMYGIFFVFGLSRNYNIDTHKKRMVPKPFYLKFPRIWNKPAFLAPIVSVSPPIVSVSAPIISVSATKQKHLLWKISVKKLNSFLASIHRFLVWTIRGERPRSSYTVERRPSVKLLISAAIVVQTVSSFFPFPCWFESLQTLILKIIYLCYMFKLLFFV